MSWPSVHRLCRHCGGVSTSAREWATGAQLRRLDKCDLCSAPLTAEDDYDTYRLPPAHSEEKSNEVQR
jgi:hypothetical protein